MVWIGAGSAVALLAGSLTFWAFHRSGPLLTLGYTKDIPFQTYSPHNLPKGYEVDRGSVSYSGGYLTFYIHSPLGRVVVTQQKKPADFTFDDLANQGMEEVQNVTVPAGKAAVAKLRDTHVGFVVTDSTLISVNGPVNLPRDAMQNLVSNLY